MTAALSEEHWFAVLEEVEVQLKARAANSDLDDNSGDNNLGPIHEKSNNATYAQWEVMSLLCSEATYSCQIFRSLHSISPGHCVAKALGKYIAWWWQQPNADRNIIWISATDHHRLIVVTIVFRNNCRLFHHQTRQAAKIVHGGSSSGSMPSSFWYALQLY